MKPTIRGLNSTADSKGGSTFVDAGSIPAGSTNSRSDLAEKMADDRAHSIATMAAEGLIRTEGEPTDEADKFLIPQCQADDHMRECIAHLVWHGEVMSEETEDGYVMVLFIDATVGAGFY